MPSLKSAAIGICALLGMIGVSAAVTPAGQRFLQEVSARYGPAEGVPAGKVQLLDLNMQGPVRAFVGGQWIEHRQEKWVPLPDGSPKAEGEFTLAGPGGKSLTVPLPWREVRQILRQKERTWIATEADPFELVEGRAVSLGWPSRFRVRQMAVSAGGVLHVASSGGLYRKEERGWVPVVISDGKGRAWGVEEVLGAAFDAQDRLWVVMKAGVACKGAEAWKFFEGKDGLPWNDFTGVSRGAGDSVWFGTHLGAIRLEGGAWHYRQGPLWLPHDDVSQVAVDSTGNAWFATAGGIGRIEQKPMTLAQKAAFYEDEIARYIKRTPFGYVAEASLRTPGDRASALSGDSDNDGLWTAMYGAGECFAVAATKDPGARERAKQAFEALRFLQKVTQGGPHSPPKGYVARTIRSIEDPDPNVGRLEQDRETQKGDRLWKAYEPRWPKSADGKWYWKSDTSSDELDGHFFFYGLYYDLAAENDAEKARVREVVKDLTDHFLEHGFCLVDHDGKPTRWGVFGPESLNRNPLWWQERGINSLSMLSYLAVASHVTGDPKYEAASRELIERHGYLQNAMFPKVQAGPGSGNQSDDEMAFMCYHSLLRYSKDEEVKRQIRFSFYCTWMNESPEMNPFFNFAYAGLNLEAVTANAFGQFSIPPWSGWQEEAMTTLYGFPLDRRDWAHRNSHRLDLQLVGPHQRSDLYEADRGGRGQRVSGKVLPVENRYFGHWNTDPWRLDYGGGGSELGAGTVFLLPYYMGLYYGFIERP